MKDQQVNSFGQGMMKDLSSTTSQQGSYTDAHNIRIISDTSGAENSSGIVVNVKGNKKSIDFTTIDISTSQLIPTLYTQWVSTGSLILGLIDSSPTKYSWPDNSYLLIKNEVWYNFSSSSILISKDLIDGQVGENNLIQRETNFLQYINTYLTGANGDVNFVGNLEQALISVYEYLEQGLQVSDAEVIGSSLLRDTLIVFLKINASAEMDVIGSIDLNAPTLQFTLVYMDQLGFDVNYPIEAVSRYESEKIQRVYWTDNLNPVRTINIKDTDSYTTPKELLNLISSVNLSPIRIKNISSGGSLPSGVYQYAYRLKGSGGSETKFTVITNPIAVVKGSQDYWSYAEDPENSNEINGTVPGEDTNKKVILNVNDVDLKYDIIEFAAIYRTTTEGIDSVFSFAEKTIEDSTMTATHSNNDGTLLLIEEVTAFELNLRTAKTINSKDNRLFLGNLRFQEDSLEFNSRAYRYKRQDSVENHYPYKETENVSTYVEDPDSIEVLANHLDAVNPFNDLDGNNLDSVKKYKYLKNGVTLGGEGPYVKYNFFKKKLSGDTLSASEQNSFPYISGDLAETDTSGFQDTSEIGDYKSSVFSSVYRGYQRDEIYRFGIVLYNKFGSPGFVNWIDDIRFPSIDDIDIPENYGTIFPSDRGPEGTWNFSLSQTENSRSGDNYYLSTSSDHNDITSSIGENISELSTLAQAAGVYTDGAGSIAGGFSGGPEDSGGKHFLYALGVEFTVNFPEEIKSQCSGYSIVRVKREQKDKTVLGVGLLNYFHRFKQFSTSRFFLNRDLAYTKDEDITKHYGSRLSTILSIDTPEFIFNNEYPTLGDNDYIQMYGGLSNGGEINAYINDFNGNNIHYKKYLSHLTLHAKVSEIEPFFPIKKAHKLGRGGTAANIQIPHTSGNTIEGTLFNFAAEHKYSGGTPSPANTHGIISTGEETFFVQLDYDETTGDDSAIPSYWENYLDYEHFGGTVDQGGLYTGTFDAIKNDKLLVACRRDLGNALQSNQYGGRTEINKKSSLYISTGHYAPITQTSNQKVFGGDTFVTFYDIEKTKKYVQYDDGIAYAAHDNDPWTLPARSFSFAFPVETTINTSLRRGYHFANKDDNGFTSDDQILNTFEYSEVYSIENDINIYIPKPFNYNEQSVDVYDSRIIYSNAKVNGSITDSWRSFKVENYKDLDGGMGEITALINNKDVMYYLQRSGFGSLSINPVSTVLDEGGSSIILGTGSVIQDFKYYSETTGASGPRSVVSTSKGVYFVDQKLKKAYAFRGNGLQSISDIHGMKSWFASNIEEDTNVVLGIDFLNDEVLFSTETTTLVFSEVINKFTSFYSYGTSMYINAFNALFSLNNDNEILYKHNVGENNTFYETKYDSALEFLVNKHPIDSKVFDSISWYTESKTNKFTNAIFSNTIDYVPDNLSEAIVKERTTRLPLPRTQQLARLRDTYLKVRLETQKDFVLHYVKTLFRISRR